MQTATLCTVFYLSFLYSQNAFPSGTPGTFQHWTTQHNGTEIFKVPLDSVIFTRSLRGLYEICTRSGFCNAKQDFARQSSRTRRQGSFLLFPSLLYASLITSSLQFDSLLYSSVYSLFYFTLLFYCSLFCVSQAIEKPSPWVLSRKEYVSKTCVPLQSVRKINATNTWFIQ